MDRIDVESRMLSSIGFEPDTSTLELEFKNGAVWQYFDFPESLWYEFETAESKGKFFHAEIKNQYSEAKVG